jgi:hypothetical protein
MSRSPNVRSRLAAGHNVYPGHAPSCTRSADGSPPTLDSESKHLFTFCDKKLPREAVVAIPGQ